MSITKAVLSKIHIAKSQLGLEDDVYRQVLARVAGVTSAKDLKAPQANQLLAEFERMGWVPKPSLKTKGKPHNFAVLPGVIEVIEAQLSHMQLPWSYADAIAKRQFGVAKVAWLKEPESLKAVLAALHVEQEKRELLAEVEGLCKRLEPGNLAELLGLQSLPNGWQRHRQTLKSLKNALLELEVQ